MAAVLDTRLALFLLPPEQAVEGRVRSQPACAMPAVIVSA